MNFDLTPKLKTSRYDTDAVSTGIVHIGLGAFHRAHQAYFIDRYMDETGDLNWGIAAVNLRKEDSATFATTAASENGYVLKTLSPEGDAEYRLVRSHVSFTDWNDSRQEAIDLVAMDSVKILTMTVTEGGYYLDSAGKLDPDSPIIAAEVKGEVTQSIYAYLRAGLNHRSKVNGAPITVLCCDNLRQNGKLLRRSFVEYLKLCGDEQLLKWIESNVSFPCCMVDRITPKPSPALVDETRTIFDRKVDSPILGEDFIQWVVEDDFKNEFPKLEKVDVIITSDIDPYEETKIRVLNGGHTCLTYLGALQGYHTYDELMGDETLFKHYWDYEVEEVLPNLPGNVPFDAHQYLETVTARFRNSFIADTIERICMDGFSKFPIFILPTVRGCFDAGKLPIHGIRSIASWYVYANQAYNGRMKFNYVEPYKDQLLPLLGADNIEQFITSQTLWGSLPETHKDFGVVLRKEIESLEKRWPL